MKDKEANVATIIDEVGIEKFKERLVPIHYRTTGPEIWQQTQGKISYFFAAFGTCGTMTGVGRYLKEQNPEINIVSVEPSSSNHKLPGMKRITGLDEQFIPKILDYSVIDNTVEVTDEDAYRTAIELVGRVKTDLY